MSLRSLVATKRPSGILPGGKVFQVPPPVVEANVPISGEPGCAGCARTGVSAGWASATCGADFVAAGGGAGGALVGWAFATAGCGEISATGDEVGAGGGGDVDFSARTIGVAEADGFGVGLPFASLPLGVGVAFAPSFPFFPTCTIAGVSTGLAGSTRMS